MAQQTAVEWLVKTLELDTRFNGIMNDVIEQAKAMEKEQMDLLKEQAKEMFEKQILDAICMNQNGLLRRKTVLEAKEYYNETYGGGESNVLGEVECYFIPSTNTSSGTICRNCGQEMFLHTFGEGIKVSTSPNPQNK